MKKWVLKKQILKHGQVYCKLREKYFEVSTEKLKCMPKSDSRKFCEKSNR